MSVDAQRAFLRRGFGPAIDGRLESVEGLTTAEAGSFGAFLVASLDHAGLDASMLELFHVTGGVPWRHCRSIAKRTHIPLTDTPPDGGAPAEHAREAVVMTVDGPPDRQRWATRTLLAALQGLHRRLEADPHLRSPAARPLLAGVSDDERHLVLRADPDTTVALLALPIDELRTVTGLPVRAVSGGHADPRRHRPVVVALTACALLLLASLVGKQWQLATLSEAAVDARAVPVVAVAPEPMSEPIAEPVAEPVEAPVPPATPEPSSDGLDVPDRSWLPALRTAMSGTGATVDISDERVSVAFSDDLLAFNPGEATLSDASRSPIVAVARFLRGEPTLRVWVEGHTDDARYSNGNWLLGAQRALAVVEALTTAGVPPHRVVLTSHGEHRPVAPNTTAAGRRKNRRVELVLVDGAPGATRGGR